MYCGGLTTTLWPADHRSVIYHGVSEEKHAINSREKESPHAGGLISVTDRTEESDLCGGLQSLW